MRHGVAFDFRTLDCSCPGANRSVGRRNENRDAFAMRLCARTPVGGFEHVKSALFGLVGKSLAARDERAQNVAHRFFESFHCVHLLSPEDVRAPCRILKHEREVEKSAAEREYPQPHNSFLDFTAAVRFWHLSNRLSPMAADRAKTAKFEQLRICPLRRTNRPQYVCSFRPSQSRSTMEKVAWTASRLPRSQVAPTALRRFLPSK